MISKVEARLLGLHRDIPLKRTKTKTKNINTGLEAGERA